MVETDELLQALAYIAIGLALGVVAVRLFWRIRSALQLRNAPDRPLHSERAVIWRDPGAVEQLDLAAGPGGPDGAPVAPFRFVAEHFGGSRPCVSVRDARNRTWRVKWGDEVQVEALATRIAWAAGYFVETTYYVAGGRVEGVPELKRAASCVDAGGAFTCARFELEEEDAITHFDEHSWSWADNPFVGTRELNGLKIMMMLMSNWDAKDVRDVARGSNTAIFEYRLPDGSREARYLISDWGGAFGCWGSVVNRGRWDWQGFADQTAQLITGVDGDIVQWGYSGQRTADVAEGIRVSDVAWLTAYLGRLTAPQLATAVRASGGTEEEAACFTRALLDRIGLLRSLAAGASAPAGTPGPEPMQPSAAR